MLPVGFKSIVTRLDAGTLTALMRGLLQAESDALGMPANALVVSEALNEGDGGLDARIDEVPDSSQTIRAGLVGFQFKAYKTKTISATEIEKELAKAGPTRVLKAGGNYVLVWEADLNDRQRTNAEKTLRDEANKIVADAGVQIWDASTIVALAEKHPAVVTGLELVEFGAVRGLSELEQVLRTEDRPYEADDRRTEAIQQLRARASGEIDDAMVVTVSGLAGTGKTRLVVEALNTDELRNRVLYADSSEGLHSFISRVVRDDRTSGILIVDELDETDRKSIYDRIAGTRGRWRLVAIVPQTTRRLRSSGARDIVLVPLDAEATRRLVEATSGLPEAKARMVAEVAQGFPELAFRLATELQADPDLDLVRLAHLERPRELLERALPQQELRDGLKPLALFTGLGVEGELAYQLDEVAAAFERDPAEMRQVLDLELSRNRFVSAAGRYRSVSPTVMAVWLAVELIDETPTLDSMISSLSDPVQEAFYRQLDLFGPEAGHLAPALARLLDDERFREPGSFDEAAGRFLRASAAVVPSQVADNIHALVAAATTDQLMAFPRRNVVSALQILLWWPETWTAAIDSLYRLARHESEGWANNASGIFADAFAIYLSGSTTTHAERIAWLDGTIAGADADDLPLLRAAAAKGLETHHTRMVVGFRGGGEPQDWQPRTIAELREARRASWSALMRVLDLAIEGERLEVVKALGHGIWAMVGDGLVGAVDADLRARTWSSVERAELLGDVQRLARHGKLPGDVRASLEPLRLWLEGTTEEERITTILATPVWELQDDLGSMTEDPRVLVEIADQISRDGNGAQNAILTGRETANTNTRFRFLSLVAQRLGSAELVSGVPNDEPLDVAAYAAAISVADAQGESVWVDAVLQELAITPAAEHVPLLTTYAEVQQDRVRLALDLVRADRARAQALGNLRGGGRFLTLPPEMIEELLAALADADALESALGMLLQLFEANSPAPSWAAELALDLSKRALVSESRDPMLGYYVEQFVARDLFDAASLAELWDTRTRTHNGLVEELDQVLTQRTISQAPSLMLGRIIQLIRDEASGEASFSLFASRDLALLSRVAAEVGVDQVWEALGPLTEHEFRIAVHHMQWAGPAPDPLVEHFLSSKRLAGYESEAFTCFYNTLGVVSGDYWRGLAGELERARGWEAALEAPTAKAWSSELVKRYEQDIKQQRRQDEEENFRLRG
jgi:hypothetical protein